MKEYIEREAAIALYEDDAVDMSVLKVPVPVIIQNLKDIPAADVVPVRHGRWISEPGHIPHCSECGRYSDDADTGEAICCPFCGARMDGDGDV